MKNNGLIQLIGFGMAFGGLILALKSFETDLETVEKKGLTFASGIALIGAGAAVISHFEDAERQAKALFA